MKYILILLSLLVSSQAPAWDQAFPYPLEQCNAQAPYGFAQTSKQVVPICRKAYVSYNDTAAKIPVWVSYTLTPDHALGCVPRPNAFAPDASLQKGARAELADYAKSGYDIGHVAPYGVMDWDLQTGYESFLLTNMLPQLPGLNRASWKILETSVKGWALQLGHTFVVYTGPIYDASDKTIGDSKVVVPHAFYKIVIDANTNQVAGFLFPHSAGLGNDLTTLRAPLTQISQLTGITFAYPANAVELPFDQLWPVDFGAIIKAKQVKCKSN